MHQQQSIFDQAERKKQEGIDVSYHNANPVWKEKAAERLRYLAENCNTFTSEDILIYLEKRGIVTGNNKAIAAIMQAGARTGMIRKTEQFIISKRPKRHGAPIQVWQSMVRKKQHANN